MAKRDEAAVTDAEAALEVFRCWIGGHPDEEMRFHYATLLIPVVMVILALVFGTQDEYTGVPTFIFGSNVVSGLSMLEAIALVTTLILAFFYLWEVIKEAGKDGALGGEGTNPWMIAIGFFSAINCVVIIFAGWYLRDYTSGNEKNFGTYIWYVGLTFLAFLVFTTLDLIAMYKSRGWKLARSYWGLALFCDGPAAIAFLLMLLYIVLYGYRSGDYPEVETIGGAVAMQLMIANTVYLIIATNLFFKVYKKFACAGIDRP